ncbi:MAG: glycosyltransferase family 4 protein, partial [Demequinaceae bacterium]|nr:glycosyltransferase family 4 protein [Demequinaceae bacterium]
VDVTSFADGFAGELEPHEQDILDSLPPTFILGASRFVSYKRLDVAIAAGEACDVSVVLAGSGPDRARLESIAAESSSPVIFVPHPSSQLLRELYVRALVYVFAPVEDFGIMPVEAMSTGTAVVANAEGGASESVLDGVTGSHLHSVEPGELRRAVETAAAASPEECRKRARDFDGATFGHRIREWMS